MAEAILPTLGNSASVDESAIRVFAPAVSPPEIADWQARDLRTLGNISSEELPAGAVGTLLRLAAGAAPAPTSQRGSAPIGRERVWTAREIEHTLAAARSSPGAIGGIPAGRAMPAIVLTLIDTGCALAILGQLRQSAFDKTAGTLTIPRPARRSPAMAARAITSSADGSLVFHLHPLTVAALHDLELVAWTASSKNDHLFGWAQHYSSLLSRLEGVLSRANLPVERGRVVRRLQAVTRNAPTLLDDVNPAAPCLIRTADILLSKEWSATPRTTGDVVLHNPLRLTLRTFIRATYLVQRGLARGRAHMRRIESAADRLCDFYGAEVLLEQLDQPLLKRFGDWLLSSSSREEARRIVRHVSMVWRFAHSAGKVATEPPRIKSQETQKSHRPPRATDTPDVVFIGNTSPRSLTNFLNNVYAPRRMAACKATSVQEYAQVISAFRRFLGCEPTLDQLNDDQIERLTAFYVRSGRSAATINGYITYLTTLWRFAWKKKLLDELPRDIVKLRCQKRLPEAWSLEQFGRILEAAAAEPGTFTLFQIPAGIWWTGLLLVLFDTGLRISAVLTLDAAAFDPTTGWLSVPPELQKQKAGQAFKLHPQTVDVLAKLPRTGKLFPTRWKSPKEPLTRRYKQIVKRAGLPHGKRDGFHKIRRTVATLIDSVGGLEAAKQQMGHSTSSLTRKSYVDPRLSSRQFIATDKMPRPELASGAFSPPVVTTPEANASIPGPESSSSCTFSRPMAPPASPDTVFAAPAAALDDEAFAWL